VGITISWLIYELSRRPEVFAKLESEVREKYVSEAYSIRAKLIYTASDSVSVLT